jgi:hypothetical protein
MLIAQKDLQRIERTVRLLERKMAYLGHQQHRRRVIPDAGGGSAAEFVSGEIIRGLLYPDATRGDGPVAGYDRYIVRLETDSTAAWDSGTTYGLDAYVIGSDGFKYQSEQAANTNHDPTTDDGTWWDLSTELDPSPLCQDAEGTPSGMDLRYFGPWYQAGDVVPLVQIDSAWYFAMQMIRLENGSTQTILWNDTDHRLMAVFG